MFCWFPESLNVTFQSGLWKPRIKKNMAASSSSAGLHENIHSGFSSESDSNISIQTETETETESETDSDSEASFMGNLQDIGRNNSEWHQVLDRQ